MPDASDIVTLFARDDEALRARSIAFAIATRL